MKVMMMVFGLLFSAVAFGGRIDNMGETDRCDYWARNAMYGASQYMRGAAREVEFISRHTMLEMLKNSNRVGHEKLYILTQESDSEAELVFLEDSTLFGYDAMLTWTARNAGLSPVRDEWRQHFLTACLEQQEI